MKVLKSKLKKVHIVKRIFFFLSIIIYIATYGLFVFSILKLKNVENLIRYIIIGFFGLWLLIYILSGLITMLAKKTKTFIFITLITLIFSIGFGGISYFINKEFGILQKINNNKIIYTSNLITLKETVFSDGLTIGMIEAEDDIEGNILAKKLIEEKNLSNKIQTYEDYHSMISDLYKGKIGACFVSSNYAINFSNEVFETPKEGEANLPIDQKVKVIFEYSEERENQDTVVLKTKPTKKLTEPFSILVMGVDSTLNGLNKNQAFNGDTLILVTFNPANLTTTMFSIPRDLYVPIACNHNRYAKINSSAAYGSSCVINTVQQLTDIDIDYYVKINFTGVVDLVEVLGGITVNVEEPDFNKNSGVDCGVNTVCEQNSKRQFGKNMIYIKSGVQNLNGEQALAYARNRHQYAASDIARNQHQQDVIVAIAQKMKELSTIKDFQNVLDTVSNNIETNMTPEQILSFYDVGKNMLINSSSNALSIKKTSLSYKNLQVWLPNSDMFTSALDYYPESLEAITKAMKVNLGLENSNAKPIKTFSISYNEEYTTPIIGKGLTGGTTLQLVKSFVGDNQFNANSWCSQVGIHCSFEKVTDSASEGLIIDQSEHIGTLIKNINSMTFKVSDGKGTSHIETPDDEDPNEKTDKDKENQDKDKDKDKENQDKDKDKDKENQDKDKDKDKDKPNPEIPGTPTIPDKPEDETTITE
ncbi:MAG TPA: hypothetical protein DCE23_08475 [Firmicutes bacterium]|nr:hypothetical protein [Bacillota bacterium]